MTANDIHQHAELQRVLWACYESWKGRETPLETRKITHHWVKHAYEKRFNVGFHQGKLRVLATLGFLQPAYTTRGGARRYYTIPEPQRVAELLKQWQLN